MNCSTILGLPNDHISSGLFLRRYCCELLIGRRGVFCLIWRVHRAAGRRKMSVYNNDTNPRRYLWCVHGVTWARGKNAPKLSNWATVGIYKLGADWHLNTCVPAAQCNSTVYTDN